MSTRATTSVAPAPLLSSDRSSGWASAPRAAQYKVFVSGNMLDGPVGMVVDHGQLLVASFTNDHILRVNTSDGELLQTFGNDNELDCPEGLAIGPDRNLYVASFLLRHVVRYELSSGAFLGQFAPPRQSSGPRPFPPPGGAEEAAAMPAAAVKPASRAREPPLLGAEDLAFDGEGHLHVTAYFHNAVHKYNGSSGEFLLAYGKGVVRGPVGITCGPHDGTMYVASYKDSQVLRFSAEGRFLGVAAGGRRARTPVQCCRGGPSSANVPTHCTRAALARPRGPTFS